LARKTVHPWQPQRLTSAAVIVGLKILGAIGGFGGADFVCADFACSSSRFFFSSGLLSASRFS